jgi:hypothetical protein
MYFLLKTGFDRIIKGYYNKYSTQKCSQGAINFLKQSYLKLFLKLTNDDRSFKSIHNLLKIFVY